MAGYKHTTALFPPQPGDAFEYDDFQNFAADFSFTGDAEASFSPPLSCPRCDLWDTSPQPIGFEPVSGYKCKVDSRMCDSMRERPRPLKPCSGLCLARRAMLGLA